MEVSVAFRSDFGTVLAVVVMLALFGIVYNLWVARQERSGRAEGMTSLHVVGGVLATLFGVAILSWQAALVCLLCFAASGAPMVAGSLNRYLELRAQHQKAMVHDAVAPARE